MNYSSEDPIRWSEDLVNVIKERNSPTYRQMILKNLIFYILNDDLLSHEDKRKIYYQAMSAYYSVKHVNFNSFEAHKEQELLRCVELTFTKAMERKELSEPEKNKLRRERFEEEHRVKQIWGKVSDFMEDNRNVD